MARTRPVLETCVWPSQLPPSGTSQADFIDLHPYPGFELNLRQYVENFGMDGMQEKPIIMGEFGVTRRSFASTASAANALVRWQVKSCKFGFDGWLLWTWDLPGELPSSILHWTAMARSTNHSRQSIAPTHARLPNSPSLLAA